MGFRSKREKSIRAFSSKIFQQYHCRVLLSTSQPLSHSPISANQQHLLKDVNFMVERFYRCYLPLEAIILVQFAFASICITLLTSAENQLAPQKEFQLLTQLSVLICLLKAEMALKEPEGGGKNTTQMLQPIVTSEHIHLDCFPLMLLPILFTGVYTYIKNKS